MRVLIIGLGSIAKKHIAALKEICQDIHLFALRSSAPATEVSGIVNIYRLENIEALRINFIIISNPTFKHKETIANLLYLNLPLFIEKPIFDSLKEEGLLTAIAERDIVTYVACNLRFLKCLQFARTFIN